MEKTKLFLILAFFFSCILIQAQEEKTSKFNIIATGGIGYGLVENDTEPNYNLNSNNVELLFNYKIYKQFGVATGIGYNVLSGNGFNLNGNFYHERLMLKIPLLITLDYDIEEKFKLIVDLGTYAQNVALDEYRFLNNSEKDIFSGWNFGFQIGIGFIYKLNKNIGLGMNINSQLDLSKLETNNNQIINDKQKLQSLNTIGLMVMLNY